MRLKNVRVATLHGTYNYTPHQPSTNQGEQNLPEMVLIASKKGEGPASSPQLYMIINKGSHLYRAFVIRKDVMWWWVLKPASRKKTDSAIQERFRKEGIVPTH